MMQQIPRIIVHTPSNVQPGRPVFLSGQCSEHGVIEFTMTNSATQWRDVDRLEVFERPEAREDDGGGLRWLWSGVGPTFSPHDECRSVLLWVRFRHYPTIWTRSGVFRVHPAATARMA